MRLITGQALNPWTVYRWTLDEKALSREGAPLVKSAEGQFTTDLDGLFPEVVKVLPLMPGSSVQTTLWKNWFPLADSLELGLGKEQGIGIQFNKPMGGESLRRSLSFSPSLPGRVEELSPRSIVFIPERDPEPGTVYNLTVSADVRDSGGLKMRRPYTQSFRADMPFLRVLSLSYFGKEPKEEMDPPNGASFPAPVEAEGGVLYLALYFSQSFETQAGLDAAYRINLEPFFPGTLLPVSLRHVYWLSSDRIFMKWEGLSPGTNDEPHYYWLNIPGGRNGINTGEGGFLEENTAFYLETHD